ncbi:hypothetical protein BDZ94DRAFT_1257484 [Collybia nuda]|uniref:Uncharacterized protein n=1 Tax=Collybia nuda TaxID=64659 RepID=A0A9P5Y7E8_9AGAR|nr:hypothetical protein BDZ94DRAFT_1257484 [Collybia nuda]
MIFCSPYYSYPQLPIVVYRESVRVVGVHIFFVIMRGRRRRRGRIWGPGWGRSRFQCPQVSSQHILGTQVSITRYSRRTRFGWILERQVSFYLVLVGREEGYP